jgi:RND superfamily putative drug exporter
VPIDSYVPMMVFAVLFGLSMDYEVFLLTAFREQWERTGDMTVSVRRGLADTGKVVTAAALIMVVVFGSFILSPDPTVKIFGIGLASAVAVDATIVRCLLVPAIMVLAQKGTWWLPGWLDRLLPHVQIEGDPADIEPDAIRRGERRPSSGGTDTDPRSLVRARPRAAVGALLGAVAAFIGVWVLLGRVDAGVIAASAAVGAGCAVLPVSDAAVGLGRRLVGLALGALLALVAVLVVLTIVPPTRASAGIAAVAVLPVALVCVLALPRSLSLPALLGTLLVALAAVAIDPLTASAIAAAVVLPAVIAGLVAAAIAPMVPAPRHGPDTPDTAGEVVSESVDIAEPAR